MELKIVETLSYSGTIYNCTILDTIELPNSSRGLIVEIQPPIPVKPLIKHGIDGVEDVIRLFGDKGIHRAILIPRHAGGFITPKLSSYAVSVYLCIPKGRKDWSWGKLHNLFWAVIRNESSCKEFDDDTEWTMWD